MKKIGFLSFGHWTPSPQSQTRTASDALLQSIDLAVAAEELGADGAFFRVHHYARQLGSPFPLLAAVGARTKRIEIGTAVIDMRYENPMYMAEDAGSADIISGGRLQLGISRGSPEQVIDGWRYFGYAPPEGETDADMARRHTEVFLEVLRGQGFAKPNPRPMFANPPGLLRLEPHSEGLRERIWWGAGSSATAEWAGKIGMNLQSSTLVYDETGEPLATQQAGQIRKFREAWKAAGHTREPRVSVSRSIFALVNDATAPISGATARAQTPSAFSATTGAPCSAAATPRNRTFWSNSSNRTRPSPKPTRCCSRCPTSSASITTPTSSRRSSSTSPRRWAGGDRRRGQRAPFRTAVGISRRPAGRAPRSASRRIVLRPVYEIDHAVTAVELEGKPRDRPTSSFLTASRETVPAAFGPLAEKRKAAVADALLMVISPLGKPAEIGVPRK